MGINDYFITSKPNIDNNKELREPQINAYYSVYEHFVIRRKESHAILIIPTGVGKTGLMGILPYGISNGRVLIITPQLMIKDTIVDSLNPDNPNNFWLKRKIFNAVSLTPIAMLPCDSPVLSVNSSSAAKICDIAAEIWV